MRGRSLLLALLSAFALGGLTLFVVPGTAHAAPSSPSAAVVPHDATPEPVQAGSGYERAMIQDEGYVYVLAGNNVFKIDKSSMKVVKRASLQ